MTIHLTKEFKFEAAHCLPGHEGKCKNVHGHQWRVLVTVERVKGLPIIVNGPSDSMVIDFSDLKAAVGPLIDRLDHKMLNDILPFRTTCENIAAFLFNELEDRFRTLAMAIKVVKITVYESDGSCAEVFE